MMMMMRSAMMMMLLMMMMMVIMMMMMMRMVVFVIMMADHPSRLEWLHPHRQPQNHPSTFRGGAWTQGKVTDRI